ncbi:hypothetical protein MPK70_gp051 [Erwinia phage pEa_SNUABM_33]|uniref:Uncharacterized protein n=1 Tax=Erwinia phage pEa_SNUABM_33 TaxID=2869556 RepID=A0AAE8C098_9CAUD|nr:hypothetical protein MPK70_gp051 [Erwinia phage pEa_SNUABM_33]QZE57927.1 hypothetical protein pEaSNUABM33_00051 [Erwinia phage pEa_SNUABM_33]WAK44416.1 hypothetical protein [Erwinia phage vB_Ea_2910A]
MFWTGLVVGIVVGVVITLFSLWYFFLKDFKVFKS